ncbi:MULTISPECIES: bifunctional cobalt-precorrin-7 (C(5))-methyltransferase/cobalt-precorrin-6B (C(15))-methyltransferase [Actibacterium]|uniref:Precorrin-6Y C5,15-methyltransferase (Decarboxylating) n=1 Tax=Actibacterium naphthalenivorans TaxID=1614693 RepID=A0A840CA37_9RHOB|nr:MULTISPECIES: bifunctional cobalt-precorrin-7 (C(5))-methyltransferase/cobalt-precorrin-6B (C(15))-methyltransferase [Actibacterium]ALG91477.1 precorrin-6Y methyltransferase [Actibacterium sp. EMB200-NS6]MBB4022914.1 precorrin-6Y C5,15-methyltransferase (decarboxylating) [Actibacterium naphthalenivorans]
MSDPWLSIIGIGEDGLNGLPAASRAALQASEIVFGGSRHLELAQVRKAGRPWPSPFCVEPVLACRGRKVAVLASGDPFWHGAGGSLAAHLAPGEWQCFAAPSAFSLAAARLGWRLEEVVCLGLHAAPFERLVPVLAPGVQAICLLRGGTAAGALAAWLTDKGFGASELHVLEALGGGRERIRRVQADGFDLVGVVAPVAVAISCAGGSGLSRASGLPDALFASDGQITKRPVRALTLSALAPRPGELLWDIGSGSGSIAVEWALAAPRARAIALEPRAGRCANIRANAECFGVAHRIEVVEGRAPDALAELPAPDAVFIGGGADGALFDRLWADLRAGTRIVANSVTLETEALLAGWHADKGGQLLRFDLAEAAPLGRMRGWDRARPIVQWSVVR